MSIVRVKPHLIPAACIKKGDEFRMGSILIWTALDDAHEGHRPGSAHVQVRYQNGDTFTLRWGNGDEEVTIRRAS